MYSQTPCNVYLYSLFLRVSAYFDESDQSASPVSEHFAYKIKYFIVIIFMKLSKNTSKCFSVFG